jgi:hypothetical protein
MDIYIHHCIQSGNNRLEHAETGAVMNIQQLPIIREHDSRVTITLIKALAWICILTWGEPSPISAIAELIRSWH